MLWEVYAITKSYSLSRPALQHHQYVLQASVLKGSWSVAESAWDQVEVDPEKEECEAETLAHTGMVVCTVCMYILYMYILYIFYVQYVYGYSW